MLRRELLFLASGVALSPGLLGAGASIMREKPLKSSNKLDHIGLQLSTVTSLMLNDFEGTLAKISEVGYDQVEFSAMGFLGRPVNYVQKLLTDNNLAAPVGRVSPALPEGTLQLPRAELLQVFREHSKPEYLLENIRHCISDAQMLGQKYLNLPALMPDNFQSIDQVKANIDLLNAAGDLCAKNGLLFGYHNHDWELKPIDGVIPFDLMLEQTDDDKVGFQLDAYWIVKGGGDLDSYLTKYPGRFPSCHMKDIDSNGDFADVGDGKIDFPAFTRKAIAQGSKYFFVERDNPPAPALSMSDHTLTLAR